MPFTDRNGNELRSLPLIYRLGRDFQVAETFCWRDPREGGQTLTIAAHNPELPPKRWQWNRLRIGPPVLVGTDRELRKADSPRDIA